MWLTQGHQIFAAFSDTGIKKFLDSVFLARPHYFNYATAALGGAAGVNPLSPLPIPGSAVGLTTSWNSRTSPSYSSTKTRSSPAAAHTCGPGASLPNPLRVDP